MVGDLFVEVNGVRGPGSRSITKEIARNDVLELTVRSRGSRPLRGRCLSQFHSLHYVSGSQLGSISLLLHLQGLLHGLRVSCSCNCSFGVSRRLGGVKPSQIPR